MSPGPQRAVCALLALTTLAAAPSPATPLDTAAEQAALLSLDPVEMTRQVVEPLDLGVGDSTLTLGPGTLRVVRSGPPPSPRQPVDSRLPVGLVYTGAAWLRTPAGPPAERLHAAAWLWRLGAAEDEVNKFVARREDAFQADQVVALLPDAQVHATLEALPPAPPEPRRGDPLEDLWQRVEHYNSFVVVERLRLMLEPSAPAGARVMLRTGGPLGAAVPGAADGSDRWLRLDVNPSGGARAGQQLVALLPRTDAEAGALAALLQGSDLGMGLPGGDPSRADGGDEARAAAATAALQRSLKTAEVVLSRRPFAALAAPSPRPVRAEVQVEAQLEDRGWVCALEVQARLWVRAEGGPLGSLLAELPGVQGRPPPADLRLEDTTGRVLEVVEALDPALIALPEPLAAGEELQLNLRWTERLPTQPELGCVGDMRLLPELWPGPAGGGWPAELEVRWPAEARWGPVLPVGERVLTEPTDAAAARIAAPEGLPSTTLSWSAGQVVHVLGDSHDPLPVTLRVRLPPDSRPTTQDLVRELGGLVQLPAWFALLPRSAVDLRGVRGVPSVGGPGVVVRLGQGRAARLGRALDFAAGLAATALDHHPPAPARDEAWLRPALATAIACQVLGEHPACTTRWRQTRRAWGRGGGWTQANPAHLPAAVEEHVATHAAAFVLGVSLPALLGEEVWWAGLHDALGAPGALSLEGLTAAWERAAAAAPAPPPLGPRAALALWLGAGVVPEVRQRDAGGGPGWTAAPALGPWPLPVTTAQGEVRWVLAGQAAQPGERLLPWVLAR